MIKIPLVLLAAGLSALVCYFTPVNGQYWAYVPLGIAYFLGFIVAFVLVFFLIATLLTIGIKKKKTPQLYGNKWRKRYSAFTRICCSVFGIRVKVFGLEKLPEETNYLIVQNHLSNVDPILTDVIFRKKRLIFVSKASLFKIPFFGPYLHGVGYLKLHRDSSEEDLQEFVRGMRWMEEEQCSIGVYPEGTRNKKYPQELLGPFKPGCFKLATHCQKPIVVTIVRGTEKVKKNVIFQRHNVQFEVVDVIEYDRYKDLSPEQLSDLVRNEMLEALVSEPSPSEFCYRKTY